MTQNFISHLASELAGLKEDGLYKTERIINSKQAGTVSLESGREVINLCANNYLGLSDNAELIQAGRDALARYGYGMPSMRSSKQAAKWRSSNEQSNEQSNEGTG